VKRIALGLIRFYQMAVSPYIPTSCRFTPSCSRYGYEAIAKYGVIRGGWLTAKRLAGCHPFSPCRFDPVP
jgi:hypothetical protein